MTDELSELMEEPAGGHNHGWSRNDFGSWSALETGEKLLRDRPFVSRDYHGRAYGYVKMRCRCVTCRAWKSLYNAEKRNPTSRGNTP